MADVYDLVVIGAGSGGLTAATFGLELGARVVLVERDHIGGDCTWTGCIPSKSLLKAAQVAHDVRTAEAYGISVESPAVAFDAVMARVRRIIEETYVEESPDAMRQKGLDVVLGAARFEDPHTVVVGDQRLRGRNIVIATGAHPFVPPVPGIEDVAYLTSSNVWALESQPRRLVVIGGGPIGCELSQAFRRLGSEVTLLEATDGLLSRDEPEASAVMVRVLEAEGIAVKAGHRAQQVTQDAEGIHVQTDRGLFTADALLVAVGRRPNVAGLDLEKAGVVYTARGIEVDDQLRTSQKHIYAVGDCLGGFQFTHYADWQGRTAVRNALLPGASKGVRAWVPWTTFTEPEVAHAGLTESQARERYGSGVVTSMVPLARIDRPRTESDTEGFIKIVQRKGKVLGVTIVSGKAGESIQEWIHVLEGHLSVQDIATTIHVYPTYGQMNVWGSGQVLEKRLRGGLAGKLVGISSDLALRWMRLWRRV